MASAMPQMAVFEAGFRGRVRAVSSLKGLGSISHSTQHSACGCVLG